MRITVSIDDEVLAAARQRAATNNETLGTAVTEIMRLGLTRRESVSPVEHGIRLLPITPGAGHATLEETIKLRDDGE